MSYGMKYLINPPNLTIKPVDVGDQESTKEEENSIDKLKLRCDGFNALNTWTIDTPH